MLKLSNLSFSFGADDIFKNLSLHITEGEKIGIIGKNGAGKSTLFRIIDEQLSPSNGKLEWQKGVRHGLLAQDIDVPLDTTLIDYVKGAFAQQQLIIDDLESVHQKLESADELSTEEILELSADLHRLEASKKLFDINEMEGQIGLVLKGLGFQTETFNDTLETFSGGWRMRAVMAHLLLSRPDILLLDEPTNHLDIESIIWLEEWLKTYKGAILLISHDNTFLQQVANRIWEIRNAKVTDFKGSYDTYQEFKIDRDIKLQSAQKNQQNRLKQLERTAERFRAKASKARMAKSIEKMIAREKPIDYQEEFDKEIRFVWPEFHPGGKEVFQLSNVGHSYDGKRTIFDHINFTINRGDKVALTGRNGEGKSTLAKIIASVFPPSEGDIKCGYNIQPYYFDQYQSDRLDGSLSVLETMEFQGSGLSTTILRSLLGAFLFSGEEVDKKVKVLSGGERNRIALAVMLVSKSNFLILDEPTNHLDIQAREALKQALGQYPGTLIVVSHDRTFLSNLSSKTWYFEDGDVKEYLGDINYVLEAKKRRKTENVALSPNSAAEEKSISEKKPVDTSRLFQLKKDLKRLEQKIERLENSIHKTELSMTNEDFYSSDKSESILSTYQEEKGLLKKLHDDWEELAESIIEME